MRLNEFLEMCFVSDVEVCIHAFNSPIDFFRGRIEDIPESLKICEVLNFGARENYFVINVRG